MDSQAIAVIALQGPVLRILSIESRHQEEHGMPGMKAVPVPEHAAHTHHAAETTTRSSLSLTYKRILRDVATFYQQQRQPIHSFLPN